MTKEQLIEKAKKLERLKLQCQYMELSSTSSDYEKRIEQAALHTIAQSEMYAAQSEYYEAFNEYMKAQKNA